MTDERRLRILAIADELESQGLPATNSAVYARALGHRGHIVTVMKARRAEARAGGVAVVEDDDEADDELTETPARVLAKDLKQLEAAYDGYHLALERLWDLENEGVWDEKISNRQTFLEKTLTKNVREQERVREELERARLREAVYAAQAMHDAGIPAAQALAEQVLQSIAALGALLEDLADVFQTQVDGFFAPRDAHGQQAFDVEEGPAYVRRLVSALFPEDFRAPAMVDLLLQTPPREGNRRAALASCARLQPFSERAISTYLHTIVEGGSNGSR